MKLIHRLLGIVMIVVIFIAASAIFIHYTQPLPFNTQLNGNQPTFDFDVGEQLQKSVEDEIHLPIVETPTDVNNVMPVHQSSTGPTWYVQIGAFAQMENATQLLKKLQQQGFQAFTRSVEIQDKTMTQVIVGPASNETDMQVLAQRLTDITQLKGRLISAQDRSS